MATSRSTSAALALAAVALAAGCGGSSPSSAPQASQATTATASGPASAIGTLLPQSIQAAGVLRIATTVSPAPVDAELGRAVGRALGLPVRFVRTSDASAAVATGRADLGWASLHDTASARTRATFVDYLRSPGGAPLGIAVKKGDRLLATALQQALQHLQADGTYRAVLAKHGLAGRAVTDFTVDGG